MGAINEVNCTAIQYLSRQTDVTDGFYPVMRGAFCLAPNRLTSLIVVATGGTGLIGFTGTRPDSGHSISFFWGVG